MKPRISNHLIAGKYLIVVNLFGGLLIILFHDYKCMFWISDTRYLTMQSEIIK